MVLRHSPQAAGSCSFIHWEKIVLIKITFLFVLLGSALVPVSAQMGAFPNELEDYEFSRMDRINDLLLLVATQDDVRSRFGAECIDGCQFNDDWDIRFEYVGTTESITTTVDGIATVFRPRKEFLDKLQSIEFRPRKPIVFPESFVFPEAFTCSWVGHGGSGGFSFLSRSCEDDSRVVYDLYDETDEKKGIQKNQLFLITYRLSESREREAFAIESVGPAK